MACRATYSAVSKHVMHLHCSIDDLQGGEGSGVRGISNMKLRCKMAAVSD